MEGFYFLIVVFIVAILILPIITIVMISKTNRTLETFVRRSERLLEMLFERASDSESSKDDLGIFFSTEDKKKYDPSTVEPAPVIKEEVPEDEETSDPLPLWFFEKTQSQKKEATYHPIEEPPADPVQEEQSEDISAKRNWEKIIGENILNKVGIGILVLGIGYFVRHAFANHNLQELGNVSIGFLAGTVLFLFGHRLRNSMRAFSSVLVGGAISVFYFTISIAFRDYELISQNAAACVTVCITAISCFLSVKYDRQELAIISLLGGLASPLMVSTGSGNHIILFSYLAILNVGILYLANKKNWKILHPIAYFGTLIYLSFWIFTSPAEAETHKHLEVLAFTILFFGMFLAQNLMTFKKDRENIRPFQLLLLVSNSAAIFVFGMSLLAPIDNGAWQGLFVSALGLLHAGLTFFLFRKKHENNYLKLLMTGLSLTFVSLIAPIQMSEHHITLFWAAEAAMLSWLGHRSKISRISKSALLLTFIMLISLAMDWQAIYSSEQLTPVLNTGILTTAVVVLAVIFSSLWQNGSIRIMPQVELSSPGKILKPLAISIAMIGIFLELNFHLSRIFEYQQVVDQLLCLYIYLFAFAWLWIKSEWKNVWTRAVLYSLTTFSVIVFLGMVIPLKTSFRDQELVANGFHGLMLLHYAFYPLLITGILKSYQNLKRYGTLSELQLSWLQSGFWTFLFITVTIEYNHLAILISWNPGQSISEIRNLVGSPEQAILWSSLAFLALFFGIRKRISSLRYFGLGLFALAMIRLFLFDLSQISETGKTIAFVSLGIFLLLISFMYQRLKSLLFESA